MQCASAILSSVASPALHLFPHFLINDATVGRVIDHKICVFYPQCLSATFLILRRNERDVLKNVYWSSCKVSVILVRFWWNLNFLDTCSKTPHILWKSVQEESNFFMQMDWRAGMTKLIVAFRSFAKENTLYNVRLLCSHTCPRPSL